MMVLEVPWKTSIISIIRDLSRGTGGDSGASTLEKYNWTQRSLSSTTWFQIMERAVAEQSQTSLDDVSKLDLLQPGFHAGDADHAGPSHEWPLETSGLKWVSAAVASWFNSSIDTVDHALLTHCLTSVGIPETALQWSGTKGGTWE